jgi:hypothetical protein
VCEVVLTDAATIGRPALSLLTSANQMPLLSILEPGGQEAACSVLWRRFLGRAWAAPLVVERATQWSLSVWFFSSW